MRAAPAKMRASAFVASTYVIAGLERVWLPGVLAFERLRQRLWARRERHQRSWLNAREACKFSQWGEDGILEALFERIGAIDERFVEFGAANGHQNTTRNLVESGWSGLWVDADFPSVNEAARIAEDRPVTVKHALVTPDSAVGILERAEVPSEFDLLAIDLDGIDYYVWDSIGRHYRPRVVAIEYNASAPPGVRWVQRYRPGRFWDGSRRFGASLDAIVELAAALDYSLVACESHGANAFFVRDDIMASCLPDEETKTPRLYRSPSTAATTSATHVVATAPAFTATNLVMLTTPERSSTAPTPVRAAPLNALDALGTGSAVQVSRSSPAGGPIAPIARR